MKVMIKADSTQELIYSGQSQILPSPTRTLTRCTTLTG